MQGRKPLKNQYARKATSDNALAVAANDISINALEFVTILAL